ncbi:hypothetical protein DUNSADRAFT_6 [Dunaliella salina]|uniref:Encoded protein n=1 Tax=Dunaliella salina TaxID=3046 RepID=A0ABQ7HAK3_DUNSA|nr:hypothetical protein DUNSADRAFT_6 [Dunaliella salina]|eukprot:KAF5843884.1 hypothetical protein DUNSADRAFT_6 [Dunaliella salina]
MHANPVDKKACWVFPVIRSLPAAPNKPEAVASQQISDCILFARQSMQGMTGYPTWVSWERPSIVPFPVYATASYFSAQKHTKLHLHIAYADVAAPVHTAAPPHYIAHNTCCTLCTLCAEFPPTSQRRTCFRDQQLVSLSRHTKSESLVHVDWVVKSFCKPCKLMSRPMLVHETKG